jgi:N6-L-threonylcarbamoyladenine synthase
MMLAFETSCDDSAIALLGMDGTVIVNRIFSQTDLHRRYGGIVPEIASRQHLTTLPLLLRSILTEQDAGLDRLQAVAVTYAPGLIGSLLVGVSYAKTIAWLQDIPLIPVDHLEGHLLAPFLDNPTLSFPYLALIASGGHTHLLRADGLEDYTLLGRTFDDAAGEAYDKVAKMLGFQYPGGPVIEQLAARCEQPDIDFPVPLKGRENLNFSFSGLKTAVRNEALNRRVYVEGVRLLSFAEYLETVDIDRQRQIENIAGSFQKIMSTIIVRRFSQAVDLTGLRTIAVTGGVAANQGIRRDLARLAEKRGLIFIHPEPKHCTDNAAMIGYTALQHFRRAPDRFGNGLDVTAAAKSPIGLMAVCPPQKPVHGRRGRNKRLT